MFEMTWAGRLTELGAVSVFIAPGIEGLVPWVKLPRATASTSTSAGRATRFAVVFGGA
nr:hypothetical protein GCM10020063_008770 [Dactylosporangium thailandense]